MAPALCIDIVPVFAHPWCQYIKIFSRNYFRCKYERHMYSHPGEYRKYSWRSIYVLVSSQGVISIAHTDFGLNTNEFCNNFGYNGIQTKSLQIGMDSSDVDVICFAEECRTQRVLCTVVDQHSSRNGILRWRCMQVTPLKLS